jgi:erythromycin esterase-like protein
MLKQRMVEYLVEQVGFTGVVLEADWPVGQQRDDDVLRGTGDLPAIPLSFPWDNQDVVRVVERMRAHNADPRHPQAPRVAGTDTRSSTPARFDDVTACVRANAPVSLPRVQQADARLRAGPAISTRR